MNSREQGLNGCLRAFDCVVEVGQNLVGSDFDGWRRAAWREENRGWDTLIDIDAEQPCCVEIAIEVTDVNIEHNEMLLYVISRDAVFQVC